MVIQQTFIQTKGEIITLGITTEQVDIFTAAGVECQKSH